MNNLINISNLIKLGYWLGKEAMDNNEQNPNPEPKNISLTEKAKEWGQKAQEYIQKTENWIKLNPKKAVGIAFGIPVGLMLLRKLFSSNNSRNNQIYGNT
jgi:hypothetical protein